MCLALVNAAGNCTKPFVVVSRGFRSGDQKNRKRFLKLKIFLIYCNILGKSKTYPAEFH